MPFRQRIHLNRWSRFWGVLYLKQTGIETQERTGFYTLRRTAATIAAQSGDVFAVQGLLGHTNTRMAGVYVQSVSEQTDKAVQAVRNWLTSGRQDSK